MVRGVLDTVCLVGEVQGDSSLWWMEGGGEGEPRLKLSHSSSSLNTTPAARD